MVHHIWSDDLYNKQYDKPGDQGIVPEPSLLEHTK